MLTRLPLFCLLSAASLWAQSQPPIRSWADAEKTETELQAHPGDSDTRGRLLMFYTNQGTQFPERVKPLRRQHILWFVENEPENRLLSQHFGTIDRTGYAFADPEGFDACKAAWEKVLAAPKPLFDSFTNAAWFYRVADPERARHIAGSGLKLYPGNARIEQMMGLLLAYSVLGVKTTDYPTTTASFDEAAAKSAEARADRKTLESSDNPDLLSGAARALLERVINTAAKKDLARLKDVEDLIVRLDERALAADPNGRKGDLMSAYQMFAGAATEPMERIAFYEKALAVVAFPANRPFILRQLAPLYFDVGDLTKAADASNEILKMDQGHIGSNYGDMAFIAHTVLGRIALGQSDTKEAERHLLAAADSLNANAQNTSMGPSNWSLASDFLAAGEYAPVLLYLDHLRAVWKNDNGRLNSWTATIRAGGIPDFRSAGGTFPKEQYIGRPAPDFRLKDLKGAEIALAEFRGKVVVLDFWATWCGPCRAEMPEFQKIHHELGGKDVVVLALDVNETQDIVAQYIEKEKFTFPVLLANATDVMRHYNVHAYPTTFFLDKNGLVSDVQIGSGPDSSSRLYAAIEKARAGAPKLMPGYPLALPPSADAADSTSDVRPASASPAAPPAPATTAEEYYADAVRQHGAKDYAAALKSLDAALALRPDWPLAVVNHADILYHLQRYDESITEWTHAIQLDPKRAANYDGRGLAYSYSHRWEQGINDFTRAIEVNPDFAQSYNNRGWSYLETGNLEDALADLNKSLALNPVYTTALFNRAHVFERQREYDKAIADFNLILHADPANKSAADQKATDMQRKGDPQK